MSALEPLLLHAHTGNGPNPFKIAIALEVLQVPYNVKLWEFGDDPKKGVRGEAFLRINENGRVPALEDPNTGVTSWESGAIMNYVRRVYDKQNKLGPRGTTEQDIVDFEKWEYLLLTTLGPMQGQAGWFKHYHSIKNEDAYERYLAQTTRCYGVLERQLEKTGAKSILPGGFSAVDCHFEAWVRLYPFPGIPLENYPMIQSWLKRMHDMEEVQKAYAKVKSGIHA